MTGQGAKDTKSGRVPGDMTPSPPTNLIPLAMERAAIRGHRARSWVGRGNHEGPPWVILRIFGNRRVRIKKWPRSFKTKITQAKRFCTWRSSFPAGLTRCRTPVRSESPGAEAGHPRDSGHGCLEYPSQRFAIRRRSRRIAGSVSRLPGQGRRGALNGVTFPTCFYGVGGQISAAPPRHEIPPIVNAGELGPVLEWPEYS